MSKILKVKNVSDYIENLGDVSRHPLVGVVDFSEVSPIPHSLNSYGVYGVFMHKHLSVDLTYGCGKYDYKNGGTIICVAPGQIGGKEDNGERINLDGWALLFHPDFLHGTQLANGISDFTFFNYNINEALHTTPEEYDLLADIMKRIKEEVRGRRDDAQDTIAASYISLLLSYCKRFYNRQFLTRKIENADVLQRFSRILDDFYDMGMQYRKGLPSVNYCAGKACMSANYFGDLVKKSTGESAISYIHQYITLKAKNLLSAGKSISDTAYDLGFDFPGHLSRMFKRIEGMSPSEYAKRLKTGRT